MLVYFLPIVGGAVADKIGFGRCVTLGIIVMFIGYLLLAVPAGNGVAAISMMAAALLLISVGTSLFKGNLQVMVGKLYDNPRYASQRDNGFSIFYMAINIGALLDLRFGRQHGQEIREQGSRRREHGGTRGDPRGEG